MTPYYADDWLTVYHGDSRAVLTQLPADSVHCVVTSPPYWGLRDYGTASWEGGDEGCDHVSRVMKPSGKSTLNDHGDDGRSPYLDGLAGIPFRDICRKCGAVRIDSQLGLEATPEEFVANMVAVFREVRRVLRSDGTVWLNLGDSYANGGGMGGQGRTGITANGKYDNQRARGPLVEGLAQKQLVGIPWRVAFALQTDGWYLRSDIIWAKPNPMPESVTDRPTKAHEYLFLLSKSARYHFDADAVREDYSPATESFQRMKEKWSVDKTEAIVKSHSGTIIGNPTPHSGLYYNGGAKLNPAGRNIRTVWTIPTAPYPGAHFATFPPKLVEPCIKAGCPQGGVVLDPFAGSGTTGMVAQSLSRRAVLIDLSMDYLKQLMERNRDIPLGLGA